MLYPLSHWRIALRIIANLSPVVNPLLEKFSEEGIEEAGQAGLTQIRAVRYGEKILAPKRQREGTMAGERLLLHDADWLLTMNQKRQRYRRADLLICANTITALGRGLAGSDAYDEIAFRNAAND